MVKPKTKSTKKWGNDDIEKAMHEIRQGGTSVTSVAKKYGMAEGTLRYRINLNKKGKEFVGSGRKPVFLAEEEKDLANVITALANLGFSPSEEEIKSLVKEYVTERNLQNPFTNDKPGRSWFKNFLGRQNLSSKKATMISSARKSATANPFIIYGFYELIEKTITEKKLKQEQIWNCDESGFPTDPSRARLVAPKGKPS